MKVLHYLLLLLSNGEAQHQRANDNTGKFIRCKIKMTIEMMQSAEVEVIKTVEVVTDLQKKLH